MGNILMKDMILCSIKLSGAMILLTESPLMLAGWEKGAVSQNRRT